MARLLARIVGSTSAIAVAFREHVGHFTTKFQAPATPTGEESHLPGTEILTGNSPPPGKKQGVLRNQPFSAKIGL
jgi:hypothetical protein